MGEIVTIKAIVARIRLQAARDRIQVFTAYMTPKLVEGEVEWTQD